VLLEVKNKDKKSHHPKQIGLRVILVSVGISLVTFDINANSISGILKTSLIHFD
jgi:hypothetical protein